MTTLRLLKEYYISMLEEDHSGYSLDHTLLKLA